MEAVDGSTIAMPMVPRISTYTPAWATRPITFAPVMFTVVWMSSRTSVITRITAWLVGFRFQLNQFFSSAAA